MSEKTAVGRIIRFGGFDLDVKAGELRRQGRTVRLQDKPLQLLMLLLGKPTSELVTREEIQEHIWGSSRFLDFEDSLNQAVRKLREALRDNASDPRFLETIPRRGYRFLMPIDGRPPSGSLPMARPPVKPLPIGPRGITVGRRRELSEMCAVLQTAKEHGARLLCISGEPGIGKTTLVETFLAGLAPGLNCHIARGRCSERLCGVEAYLPILEGLDSLMYGPNAEIVRKSLVEVAPSWYVQMADCRSGSVAGDAAAASQERKKREFVSFLESLTQEQPLILLLTTYTGRTSRPSTCSLMSFPTCSPSRYCC